VGVFAGIVGGGSMMEIFPPEDKRSRMRIQRKLVLYSDQEIAGNGPMDDRLLRLIGRPRPRIGYISATPDPERTYFQHTRDYYAAIGADVPIYIDSHSIQSGPDWKALFLCDGIHLSGGNTFSFVYWLRQRNLLKILTQYVSEGGVLIGVSAGAILMSPSMRSAELCGDVRVGDVINDAAMGLVDFHIWPHFDSRAVGSTQAELASSLPNLYGCPDGAGIIIDGERVELFGRVSSDF
jgi:dipeptidase E